MENKIEEIRISMVMKIRGISRSAAKAFIHKRMNSLKHEHKQDKEKSRTITASDFMGHELPPFEMLEDDC